MRPLNLVMIHVMMTTNACVSLKLSGFIMAVNIPVIYLGPVAGALLENFSEDLECATTTQQWWQNSAWFYNDHRFQTNAMTADSSFFKTMGVTVFTGDPNELNNPDVLFISRSLAKEMFASQDPVGKTVVYNKQMPMTVKGVYEDFRKILLCIGRRLLCLWQQLANMIGDIGDGWWRQLHGVCSFT